MSKKLTPGIYNYCDRWCERCTMTHACQLYEEEQAAIAENPDIKDKDNPAFWKHISDQFAKTMKMILEDAERRGIDLTETEEDRLAYEAEQNSKNEAQDATLFIQLARKYWKTAKIWLDKNTGKLKDQSIQKLELNISGAQAQVKTLGEALDIISWYLFQIEVKLRRAHGTIHKPDDEFEQSNSNGSAKVALIGIERSIGAWSILYEELPEEQDTILDFLVTLQKTRKLVLEALPNAMAFKRPGFDN